MDKSPPKFKPVRKFSTQFLCNIILKYENKSDIKSRRIYMKALTELKYRNKHEDQGKWKIFT